MDFMYDFLMFQHGNHDTNEKIEYYQNFIMSLLGELKTLRETMCASCQRKCASSKAGNQSLAASQDSTIVMRSPKPPNVEDHVPTSPRMHETDVFWQCPSSGSSSPHLGSLVMTLAERSNESDSPTFYAERDSLADTTIEVTFVRSFCQKKNYVRCVCFSPDGRYMALGTGTVVDDGSIVIYEVETHEKYRELREYASQYGSYPRPLPWNLCFSSDGRYLAVVDDAERIIIWDVPYKQIRSIFRWNQRLYEVRFSLGGRLVVLLTATGLVVLNVRDFSWKLVSEGSYLDISPNGRYIATDNNDGDILILDVRTGKPVKRWNKHGAYIYYLKFTSDGRGLLCAYNDRVEQWDVNDAVPVRIKRFDFQSYCLYVGSSPDQQLLAFDSGLWDVESGKLQYIFKGHNPTVSSVEFSAAGPYLAMSDWNGFRFALEVHVDVVSALERASAGS